MTAQISDLLIFDGGAFRLPEMSLYGVLTGDIDVARTWRRYPFATKGNPKKISAYTALGRGYVSTYRLTATGLFVLEQLQYPISGAPPDRFVKCCKEVSGSTSAKSFSGKACASLSLTDESRKTARNGGILNRNEGTTETATKSPKPPKAILTFSAQT